MIATVLKLKPCLAALGLVSGFVAVNAATIYVHPGDNLSAKINSAVGGDMVLVYTGTYANVTMTNKVFTQAAPVIVRAMGTVVVKPPSSPYADGVNLQNCAYVAFDSIHFEGGQRGGQVIGSNHVIFKNCQFRNARQEGLHIKTSSYVDVRGGKIYNTGQVSPGYGEGIYVGNGSSADICSYVWIENVEVYDTGNGEGIEFKPGVSNSTIRACNVHDISPGIPGQTNEGAIVVNGYDYSTFVLSAAQNNWVEYNTVSFVAGGHTGKNRGIVFFGSGVKVKNNIVHDCVDEGILASSWLNKGYTNWVYANSVYDCDPNYNFMTGNVVNTSNPGTNPFSKQTWF